ncbi:DDE-type integrase/transposase/recombinase [Rhodococcus hoagii]|nr:DDE-type integrase/transposase/recombinase [Prescottella equi]
MIERFSRAIVGWHASSVKDTAMVTTALEMALRRRDHGGHAVADGLIHHSDAGSQYTSISLAETLALEGIVALIGSAGDAYDNALAESTIRPVQDRGRLQVEPVPGRSDQSDRRHRIRTMELVDWFNTRRLHSTLGFITPDEFEAI